MTNNMAKGTGLHYGMKSKACTGSRRGPSGANMHSPAYIFFLLSPSRSKSWLVMLGGCKVDASMFSVSISTAHAPLLHHVSSWICYWLRRGGGFTAGEGQDGVKELCNTHVLPFTVSYSGRDVREMWMWVSACRTLRNHVLVKYRVS